MSDKITTPTGRWLVKLLRAVPRGKSLTDEQRHLADLIEQVLPQIEAEAQVIPALDEHHTPDTTCPICTYVRDRLSAAEGETPTAFRGAADKLGEAMG